MKKILIVVILFASCKATEQRKIRREKIIVLSSMAAYAIQMKLISDKQKVIK